jgi:hypothetical protein
MLIEEAVIAGAPQTPDVGPAIVIPAMAAIVGEDGGGGSRFFKVILRLSPGRTCRVGDWEPLSVVKQYRMLPFRSVLV